MLEFHSGMLPNNGKKKKEWRTYIHVAIVYVDTSN